MKTAKLILEVVLRIDDCADARRVTEQAEARAKTTLQHALCGGDILDVHVETKKVEVHSVSDR